MCYLVHSSIGEENIFKRAFDLAKVPIVISLFITIVRFSLEWMGIPDHLIFFIGLLWFTIGISIYWSFVLYQDKYRYLIIFLALIILSPFSRIPVSIFWWIDNHWSLGTHYGLFYDSIEQVLFNQLLYGSLVQIIPGFIACLLTITVLQFKKSLNK